MKITKVLATPVSARTTRSNAWSRGKGTGFSRTIIEIGTDQGLTGLGEAPRGDTAEVVNRYFAPRLIGLDPSEWQTARLRCLPRNRDWGLIGDARERMAFGGVDMALWDLVGKSLERPLFRVLGGPVRKVAPFVAYAYSVDTSEGITERQVPDLTGQPLDDALRACAQAGFTCRAVPATGPTVAGTARNQNASVMGLSSVMSRPVRYAPAALAPAWIPRDASKAIGSASHARRALTRHITPR